MKRRCPKCGAEWDGPERIGVREECPECAAFLHTCVNCSRYDASTRTCTLPDLEAIRDANVANYCEEFTTGPVDERRTAPGGSSRREAEADARKRFEDLFRDGDA